MQCIYFVKQYDLRKKGTCAHAILNRNGFLYTGREITEKETQSPRCKGIETLPIENVFGNDTSDIVKYTGFFHIEEPRRMKKY